MTSKEKIMANNIVRRRSPSSGDIARFGPFRNFGDITRLDPFASFDDWFQNFGMRPFSSEMETVPLIKMDLSENDTAYTVRAEIPGVKKEDVKVQLDGRQVSISAETKQEKEEKEGERVVCRECHQGMSYRSFTLDSEVDDTKAEAKYENGTLELTLPKKGSGKSRKIEIK